MWHAVAAAVSPVVDLRSAGHPHRFGRPDGAPASAVANARQLRPEMAHDVHRDSVGTHDHLQPDRPASRGRIHGWTVAAPGRCAPELSGQRRQLAAARDPAGAVAVRQPAVSRASAAAPTSRSRRWCATGCELTSDFYRPEYLRTVDALEFDVHPYDDSQPPAVLPNLPHTVLLLPSTNYPHAASSHRARTARSTRSAIRSPTSRSRRARPSACSATSVAYSRCRCAGSPFSGPVVIDAVDNRTGRTDQITLTLPQDLQQGHSFTLT